MTSQEILKTLKAMGTAQNKKIYLRHGAQEPLFGVSFANIRKLQKKIKQDQVLAEQLFASKNMDARSLALLIANPETITKKTILVWLKECNYALLINLLADVVAKSSYAKEFATKWMPSKKEFTRQAGYNVLSITLKNGDNVFTQTELKEVIKTIEKEIHASPNRAKHAMNMCLISIGIYIPGVRKQVIASAKRIGKVEVDHGETSCKTPDAINYIERAVKRQK